MDITGQFNRSEGSVLHFLFLGIWMFSMGLRHIINHHVSDIQNDLRSETSNLAVELSPLRLRKLVQSVLFPVEIVVSIAFFASFIDESEVVVLLAIALVAIAGASHLQTRLPVFTVWFGRTKLDDALTKHLGVLLSAILSYRDPRYLLILVLYVVLFTDFLRHPLTMTALKWIRQTAVKTVLLPWRVSSLIFNWGIYYFRKWVLNWGEQRNWGVHYPKRLQDLELNRRRQRGTIAVFNQNFNKYTETFVAGRIRSLPFHVIPYHGWPSPIHVENMENLIGSEPYLQEAAYSIAQLRNKSSAELDDERIIARLIKDKVQLMLAEFGTMGARVVELSKASGIPLIVTFYGYDAWNAVALEENKELYPALFEHVACVLGVSMDICRQLEKLGCPKEKIQYLPCYVDIEQFKFVERSFESPRFLSVGRFCQTKAPQLTILAFSEVVKTIPEAHLTMIGADDGHGVLESCKSLTKALNIQDQVEFKGGCSSDEVYDEMSKASVFVQHSITTPETGDREGTPVAVMEALATGLPVVATHHAGIQEMIEHGVNGKLVNEFDYLRMAKEMIALVQNRDEMKRIGNEAALRLRTNPLVVGHIERLTEIIDKHLVRV